MKAFLVCLAVILVAVPAYATSSDHDRSIFYDGRVDPGERPHPDRDVRVIEPGEDLGLGLDQRIQAGPAFTDGGIEYISSCLWTDLSDIHAEDGFIYCALTYGLMILDARGGLPFETVSTLYLHTTYGRGDALEKHGDYVYFLRRDEVVVIDVTDVENPAVVSSYPCEGNFLNLTCADDVLYLLDSDYGLKILDVSDPRNPALLSSTAEFGINLTHIAVAGDMAVTGARNEFQVLDVSDPANPALLSSRDIYGAVNTVISGSIAFTYKFDLADSIIVMDLSDPAHPARSGAHVVSNPNSTSADMMIAGSYLITAAEIIDVSDPSSPVSINIYSYYNGYGLCLMGDNLFKRQPSSISIYDATDLETASFTGSHAFYGRVMDVYVRDDIAYAGLLFQGLVILDISDIHHPVVLSELEHYYQYTRIDVQENILVSGGHIVDIGDPSNPVVLAGLGNLECFDVKLKGNLAFVVGSGIGRPEGLSTFDLSDPANPVLLSVYATDFSHHAQVAVKDSLVFLTTYTGNILDGSIHILDYSDPAAPELISTYGERMSLAVAVDGDLMYTRIDSDLHVVDIQDPHNPVLIGIFDQFSYWSPVTIIPWKGYLYTTSTYGSTVIFDVSDPTNPIYVENFRTPSESADNLFIVDDKLFLADYYALMITRTPYDASPPRPVSFDVKPGSCPNPLNWRINPNGKSVIPVAICGSEELDVRDIDVSSLSLLDDLEPVRYGYEDVTSPADSGGDCPCGGESPDGYVDLTIKFDRRAVLEKLHMMPDAEMYVLTITGLLTDGERIEGHDCIHPVGREHGGRGDGPPVADGGSKDDRSLVGTDGESLTIKGNYPNPFNPATDIRFGLIEGAHVTIDVFNIAGQRVAVLTDRHFAAGDHAVRWNGKSLSGQPVASGVYFYRVRAGETAVTKKMLLLR